MSQDYEPNFMMRDTDGINTADFDREAPAYEPAEATQGYEMDAAETVADDSEWAVQKPRQSVLDPMPPGYVRRQKDEGSERKDPFADSYGSDAATRETSVSEDVSSQSAYSETSEATSYYNSGASSASAADTAGAQSAYGDTSEATSYYDSSASSKSYYDAASAASENAAGDGESLSAQSTYGETSGTMGYYNSSASSTSGSARRLDAMPGTTDSGKRASKKKETKSRMGWGRLVAMAASFGLVAGVVFQGVNVASSKLFPQKVEEPIAMTQPIEPVTNVLQPGEGEEGLPAQNTAVATTDIATVAQSSMPSIVSITNMSETEVELFFFGSQTIESESVGSGIIVAQDDTDLLIVTNNHVVEGSTALTVTFSDEESATAELKGTDPDKDLAVLAVKLSSLSDSTKSAIKVATLGDSTQLMVGEPAIAIGNALGYGQSVTSGIISATNRLIEDEGLSCELIQTDAAINPGNSGGALLNAAGEVIGINTIKVASTEVESMGYAIPISDALPIINELMQQEARELVPEEERGSLGIRCMDINTQTATAYGMPMGLYVTEVMDESSALAAGMEKGDIITKFEGASITTAEALKNRLEYYRSGEEVTITVSRLGRTGEYEEVDLKVKLG